MSTEIVKSYIWCADVDYTNGAGQSVKFMSAEASVTPRLLETFRTVYDASKVSDAAPAVDSVEVIDIQITSLCRVEEIYGDVAPIPHLRSGSIIRFGTDGTILEVNRARAEKLSGLN